MDAVIHSLLAKAGPVIAEPYPHVVIHDALDYYEELNATRPADELILRRFNYGPNRRVDMMSAEVLLRRNMPEIWKKFVRYHTSPAFFSDILQVFGTHIRKLYPGIPWDSVKANARGIGDLGMECQPGVNTPLTETARVRGPHLDNPRELYGGMLYMPHPDDTSTGGELQICRWKAPRRFHGKLECYDEDVEVVSTVPYKTNTLVMFINGLDSVHAVTPRTPSPTCRRLVNIAADYQPRTLFTTGHGKF